MRPGTNFTKVCELIIEILWKLFFCVSFKSCDSIRLQILHMAQQFACYVMYKIEVWLDHCFDDLTQDCSNSTANAVELLQSCTKLSISPARTNVFLQDLDY